MSRTFTVAVLIYVLFFIILGHGYLQKEEPFVGMDLSLDMVRPRGPLRSLACSSLTRSRPPLRPR
jgi:hypothetical protein